jgi:hypothetical protein
MKYPFAQFGDNAQMLYAGDPYFHKPSRIDA